MPLLPDGTLQRYASSIKYARYPTHDDFFAVLLDLYHCSPSNFQYGFDTAVSINIKLLGKITAEQSSFRSSTAFKPPKGFFAYLEWNQSRGVFTIQVRALRASPDLGAHRYL